MSTAILLLKIAIGLCVACPIVSALRTFISDEENKQWWE